MHPILLRVTPVPVGRRASGFVLVGKDFPNQDAHIGKRCGVREDLFGEPKLRRLDQIVAWLRPLERLGGAA